MSALYLPNIGKPDIFEPQLCSRGAWQRVDKANSPMCEASAIMGMLNLPLLQKNDSYRSFLTEKEKG